MTDTVEALTARSEVAGESEGLRDVSLEGTKQLMQLLIRRGYFHSTSTKDGGEEDVVTTEESSGTTCKNGDGIIRQLDPTSVDSLEKYLAWKEEQESVKFFSTESPSATSECCIIPTIDGTMYYSPKGLAKAIVQVLDESPNNGRLLLSDATKLMNVPDRYLQDQTSLARLAILDQPTVQHILLDVDQKEVLLSSTYWTSKQKEIKTQVKEQGLVRIIDLASRLHWTMDIIMTHLVLPVAGTSAAARSAPIMSSVEPTVTSPTEKDNSLNEANFWTVIWKGGVKVLVSQSYLAKLKQDVLMTFQELQEPVLVSKICEDPNRGWDHDLVVDWIADDAKSGGQLHVDSSCQSKTTRFVPCLYTQKQRQNLNDFFAANGYLNVETANRYGVLPHQMIQWIVGDEEKVSPSAGVKTASSTKTNASVIVLGNTEKDHKKVVLLAEHVLQRVQAAIQESCKASGDDTTATPDGNHVVDLQDYLPLELLNKPETIRLMLEHIGFNETMSGTSGDGVSLLTEGQGMIVSVSMVEQVRKTVLPPLIQTFAKSQAEKLNSDVASLAATVVTEEESSATTSRKGARNKRKAKKESRKTVEASSCASVPSASSTSIGVVPLLQVTGAILKAYPNWMPEGTEEELLEQADRLSWEEENDSIETDLLLVQFCKRAVYTDQFRQQCHDAVRAELKRLQSQKQSKASLSRKDAAAKVRTVEGAFEDVFITLCRMIQVIVKFHTLASTSTSPTSNSPYFDEEAMSTLEAEILQGCCADLTSRVTQHCLFKNEEEGGIFSFVHPDTDTTSERESSTEPGKGDAVTDEAGQASLPAYCYPLDTAVRRYPRPYLSCPPPRDPLPLLRESLPGTIGVSLARQWILCGGECYLGGVKTRTDDSGEGGGATFIRPGNMEQFLRHVEENCLTMCGLPFKKLDKKSEKQFLFTRRQLLTQILQSTADPEMVLEVTIMILFQQVKQVVVTGSLLKGPILNMLVEERKIPNSVAQVLRDLANQLEKGETAEESLINAVRECGLCRDVSKFQVDGY